MTHTIEFSPEVEARLQELAQQRGASVEAVAAQELAAVLGAGEPVANLYARSIAEGGELTAFSHAQEDLHEYSAEELAAMDAGAEQKQRDIAARLAAVNEFTQAAHKLSDGAAAHGGSWSREEIYEGEIERVLGIGWVRREAA